jgi:GT2 family glycosyltransferase
MISLCVPVHDPRATPRLAALNAALPSALAGLPGELVLALNGVPEAIAPPGARVVALDKNLGIAPGWNAAASAAQGEILVFGNDDLVFGPQSLALLAQALQSSPAVGVVGVDSWGWVGEWQLTSGAGAMRECETVRGPVIGIRAEVFAAVQGFDEAYAPCCWEEVDLGLAVRNRLELRAYVLSVPFQHEPGISSRRALPWVRVAYAGRSESLRSIRRRNRRRLREKWGR